MNRTQSDHISRLIQKHQLQSIDKVVRKDGQLLYHATFIQLTTKKTLQVTLNCQEMRQLENRTGTRKALDFIAELAREIALREEEQ